MGRGGSSEGCLKWGGGGSLRDLSKNILKQGWVKAKVVRRGGGGFEGVTTPAPQKILIIHQATTTENFHPRVMVDQAVGLCHRIT